MHEGDDREKKKHINIIDGINAEHSKERDTKRERASSSNCNKDGRDSEMVSEDYLILFN